jgi:hypothetical protein
MEQILMTGEVLPAESPYNEPVVIRALFKVLSALGGPATRKSPEERMEENLAAGRPRHAGLPWTEGSRSDLAEKYQAGTTVQELARFFERTNGAILPELARQGLVDQRGPQ